MSSEVVDQGAMAERLAAAAPPAPSLYARLQRGVSWNLVGSVVGQGSILLVNVVVANQLGREAFGEFAILLNTIATWANFAALGLGFTAMKYLAELRSTDRERAGRIVSLCRLGSAVMACVAGLFLVLAAPALAEYSLHAAHLAPALVLGAGGLVLTLWHNFQKLILTALEEYSSLGVASMVGGLFYVLLCVAASLVGTVEVLIVAVVASLAVQCLVAGRMARTGLRAHHIPTPWRGAWRERSVLWRFSLPMAISAFSLFPALWLSNISLLRREDGYQQLALFTAANNLRVMVLFLPGVVNNVVCALLNHQRGNGDTEGYRRLCWANAGVMFAATCGGGIFVALVGPWLLRLYGRDFTGGYGVLLVLLVTALVEVLVLSAFQVLQSQGKVWQSLFTTALPRDVTLLVLAYNLTDTYGAYGLATANLVSQGVALLVVSLFLLRLSRAPERGSV